MPEEVSHDPYAPLRYRNYNLYTLGRNLSSIGSQITFVALGWEIYQRTSSALLLGYIGLAQVAPVFLIALPAGHMADRFDRKTIVLLGQVAVILSSFGLLWLSHSHGPVGAYYLCILGASVVGAFAGPARGALLPLLVPAEVFPIAVTWNTSAFQVSSMIGPALGGVIIGKTHLAWPAYGVDAGLQLASLVLTWMVSGRFRTVRAVGRATLETLLAGIRFVWRTRIILATITLDLFAVLLGGCISLLPVYAKDILHVGPTGLGWMNAAPSAGALLMALTLAHLPPMKKAGAAMLLAVALFGVTSIVFGLSRSLPISLAALFVAGAVDNISVVVRHTLVQVLTPDEMRGRVSAVNGVFISSSNGLGGFESGLVAHWLGPVISVVSGGVGTILVVLAVALAWPEVRRFGSLRVASPAAEDSPGQSEISPEAGAADGIGPR